MHGGVSAPLADMTLELVAADLRDATSEDRAVRIDELHTIARGKAATQAANANRQQRGAIRLQCLAGTGIDFDTSCCRQAVEQPQLVGRRCIGASREARANRLARYSRGDCAAPAPRLYCGHPPICGV